MADSPCSLGRGTWAIAAVEACPTARGELEGEIARAERAAFAFAAERRGRKRKAAVLHAKVRDAFG